MISPVAHPLCNISIHTPTKGATVLSVSLRFLMIISIHTPTKGATTGHQHTEIRDKKISIHTPTKGATKSLYPQPAQYKISIHTPTKGATAILTNNFLFFCSISLINFVLYLKNIQILFIFRYKFNFSLHILSANLPLFLCLLYTRIAIKSMVDQLVFLYLHQNVLL